MKKTNLLLFILLINSFLCVAQKQWKYEDLKMCKTVWKEKKRIFTNYKVSQDGKIYIAEVIKTVPASTKWVKKKAEKNCLSPAPDDCLVWCLVEVPAEYRTVKDSFNVEDIKVGSGYFSYSPEIETVCEEAISVEMLKAIGDALCKKDKNLKNVKLELSKSDFEKYMEDNLFEHLDEYQLNNSLPVGYLDIETLVSLGVVKK